MESRQPGNSNWQYPFEPGSRRAQDVHAMVPVTDLHPRLLKLSIQLYHAPSYAHTQVVSPHVVVYAQALLPILLQPTLMNNSFIIVGVSSVETGL